MSSNEVRNDKPEEKVGFFWIIVAVVLRGMIYLPAKNLLERAYKESTLYRAIGQSVIGGLLSIVSAVLVSYQLGWQQDWWLVGWLPAGIATLFATFIYAWCPIYIWVYRPLEKLSRKLWDRVHTNSDYRFPYQPVTKPVTAPGQEGDSKKEPEKKEVKHLTWFSYLLVAICYFTGIAGFAYLGYNATHSFLHAGAEWLPWVVWTVVGMISFGVATGWSSRDYLYSKMHGVACLTGILFTYAIAGYVSTLGIGAWQYLVYFATFIAWEGIAFPALHTFISECFYWVYKGIDKLDNAAYSNEDRKYKSFYTQVTNIAVALWIGSWTFHLVGMLVLPAWTFGAAPAVAAVLAVLLSYIWIGQFIKDTGALTAVCVLMFNIAFYGWTERAALHSASGYQVSDGVWNGITCGGIALAILAMITIAYPVVHLVIRFITRDVLRFGGSNFAHAVGFALTTLHKKVYDGAEVLVRKLGRAYNETYKVKHGNESDKTYRQAFLQVVNVIQTVVLTGAAALAIVHAHPGTLGLAVAAGTSLVCFLVVYVLWGKVTIESGVGLVGWITSFAVGISVGAFIHLSAISGYGWLFGLIAWSLTYRFVFPIGYVVAEFIFNRGGFPASVRDTLAPIHDALWSKVVAGWTVAVSVMAVVGAKIAAAWRRISGGGKK